MKKEMRATTTSPVRTERQRAVANMVAARFPDASLFLRLPLGQESHGPQRFRGGPFGNRGGEAPSFTAELDTNSAVSPPALANTFETQPTEWVVKLAVHRLDLADALERADERERSAKYAAERLTEMVAIAGPVLTPAQEPAADDAKRLLRPFDQSRDDPGR